MKWTFLFFFFILSTFANSQDTSSKKTGNIYFKGFSGWKQNGVRLKQKEFKQEIYKVPAAVPFYKKGNTNIILCYPFFASGAALLFINSKNQSYGLFIASTGLISGGILTAILSHHNLKKAARIYNERMSY